jgi:hypothetical protein
MNWTLLPESNLLILAILMSTARFENQRWIRARMGGFRGSNLWYGFFVDCTGFFGNVFNYAFLTAYFYDKGIYSTLYLIGILFISGLLITLIFTRFFRGDNPIVWFVGTLCVWPLAALLFSKVSWFGLY